MTIRKILTSALLLLALCASAQMDMQIPIDPEVRIGKLPNGLTYYIRHNNQPQNVANFYIAQRVGSINENDDQRGLAHFLEHMAFNGSEHFPGNNLIEYLRSLGVSFGRDLNAYTSIDQTVYNINNVPSQRQSAVDSCLLILRDWSNGLSLEAEEIDKERGVVHGEWRSGSGPQQRMLDAMCPELFPDSKYGHRLPIGLMSIIDSFRPHTLRAYYEKWYRPDNQAIVVVGNVDVDHVEAEIKRLWADVTVAPDAAQVVTELVPDNNEAIIVIGKDKEQQRNTIEIMMKHDVIPDSLKGDISYMIMEYGKNVTTQMIDTRLQDAAQQPGSAFTMASSFDGQYIYAKSKDALTTVIIPKEGQDIEAIKQVMRELERARQHGFTESEYVRAREDIMNEYERMYTNRSKVDNDRYARQYVEHYLSNEPIPSIEDKYETMKMIVPMIPVDIANEIAAELVLQNDTNLVVAAFTRDIDGTAPYTAEMVKNAIDEVRNEDIKPYVDQTIDEPLIAKMPKKGKIKKETVNTALGYTELTLSNGIKVNLKKTDFKDDEIRFQAIADGGFSLYDSKDFDNIKMMQIGLGINGLGKFSQTDLEKALAGKHASVDFSIDQTEQTVSGVSTPKDLETLMQLIYLQFTNATADKATYDQLAGMFEMVFKNKDMNPSIVFGDSIMSTINKQNPRYMLPDGETFGCADYNRIVEIIRERLANAADYTFTFVGNFDESQMRRFIEQYIASLPAKGKKTEARDVRTLCSGETVNNFTAKMIDPQSMIFESWRSNNIPYTLQNRMKLAVAAEVLEAIYLKSIREDSGAAYSVSASDEVDTDGREIYFSIQAQCPCDPDKNAMAVSLFRSGIQEAATKIDADMFSKVKEQMLKQFDVDSRENSHWINAIYRWNKFGVDFQSDYRQTLQSLTADDISRFISEVLIAPGHHTEVIMMPETGGNENAN